MARKRKREYYGSFGSWKHVLDRFCVTEKARHPEPEFVFACYSVDSYSGSACVLFYRRRSWWWVKGGHCSCYGLEGQWEPEKVDLRLHMSGLKSGKRIMTPMNALNETNISQSDFDDWVAWAFKKRLGARKKVAGQPVHVE